MFTWKPIYTDVCQKLLPFKERNSELVELLEQMRSDGLKITPLQDKDADGNAFTLKEMDPFTFLGTFNRSIRPENRTAILHRLKDVWGLSAALPQDYNGIPILNPQNSWFMPNEPKRKRSTFRSCGSSSNTYCICPTFRNWTWHYLIGAIRCLISA